MARPRANIRISLKTHGGPTHRIELVRIPFTKRFRIRRNGTKSAKLTEGTATEVAEEIRRWLAKQTSKPTTAEDILGSPDLAVLSTEGLRSAAIHRAQGDLRSAECAGSGDPRTASVTASSGVTIKAAGRGAVCT